MPRKSGLGDRRSLVSEDSETYERMKVQFSLYRFPRKPSGLGRNCFGAAIPRWLAYVRNRRTPTQDSQTRLTIRAGNPTGPHRAFLAGLTLHVPQALVLPDLFSNQLLMCRRLTDNVDLRTARKWDHAIVVSLTA